LIALNVYQARTHFSRLLRRVKAGEEFVIADAGKPVARLVPFAPPVASRLGGDEGRVWIADDFDDPLSPSLLGAFWGQGDAPRRRPRARRRRRARRP
jgi:prevent-host-death family protein